MNIQSLYWSSELKLKHPVQTLRPGLMHALMTSADAGLVIVSTCLRVNTSLQISTTVIMLLISRIHLCAGESNQTKHATAFFLPWRFSLRLRGHSRCCSVWACVSRRIFFTTLFYYAASNTSRFGPVSSICLLLLSPLPLLLRELVPNFTAYLWKILDFINLQCQKIWAGLASQRITQLRIYL